MTEEERRQLEMSDKVEGVNRREFLAILASSFAGLTAAGCKIRPPKEKIVPFADQPEGAAPGLAQWYATTCGGCSASCGALAKSRDGRPIKLEGNLEHPLSRGGLCARGQASVLDLYDSERLRQPLVSGSPAGWSFVDSEIKSGIEAVQRSGKKICLITQTLTSPSEIAAISQFVRRFPESRHIVYDSLSASAILQAHERTHGRRVLPHYRFSRARTIVGFDADFLGTWISPVEFTKDWAANRDPDRAENKRELMSWHAQFESRMSLTGSNADLRVPIRPSEQLPTLLALARRIAKHAGASQRWPGLDGIADRSPVDRETIDETASALFESRKRSLIVCGSSDVASQMVANWINELLGNYGETVDISRPSLQLQGDDGAMHRLIGEIERGEVGALITYSANPAYDQPQAEAFVNALPKVGLTIALAERRDETAQLAKFVCPVTHFLEAWGDAAPNPQVHSLRQPLLSPLFDSRPALESFLVWCGRSETAYDFIREYWRQTVFPKAKDFHSFRSFWQTAVQRGVVSLNIKAEPAARFNPKVLEEIKSNELDAGAFSFVPYPAVALADGRQANNPWLQELPDPVSRVAWGNYASFSPDDARRLHIEDGTVVRIKCGDKTIELPAHVQVGMASGVVAAAVGYGRVNAGRIAANYPMIKLFSIEKDLLGGADVYPLIGRGPVSIEATSRVSPLAKVQTYDFLTDPILGQSRPIVEEATLLEYARESPGGSPDPSENESLWPKHQYTGHKWAMAINLNSCTGCSSCVIACQAENNVPVVGKAEVRNYRDMAWLRIDRYYSGGPADNETSPDVAFQPMLCQHCDSAPCETVCPVLATVHSSEGLNMQVYNRCVGTRYCANNCPYKVRRFNWFDYAHQDLVQNMALNPDVTVRSRGVMEKCSFCVQRIYSAKFQAKSEDRELEDGDVKTACQQSCPAEAIVFGDINDPNSKIAKIAKHSRSFRVLTEIGTGPSVFYQKKIRNKKVA